MELIQNRKLNEDPEATFEPKPEVHGSWVDFQPWGDRVLVRRLKTVQQGLIARPDAYTELAERGVVVAWGMALGTMAPGQYIVKFSKYGAEEILFDDSEGEDYCLVWEQDIRGFHARD